MIHDLNEIQEDPFKGEKYDVCIIGGGFAGITLAMYLKKELKILLLEGGGLDYSQESQEIYKGKNIGWKYPALDEWRIRCLGGTSLTWGGWCANLRDFDFKEKDYIKYSGWPIGKKDLDPFFQETCSVLDLPSKTQVRSFKGWTDKLEAPNDDFDSDTFRFSYSYPPTNFKVKYESELKKRKNIHCYVNANLTDMALSENLSSVQNIEVKNYRDGVFRASAKVFVLATGGIENARLLLNFNKQVKNGIGNENDLVGRFFSDHMKIKTGYFIVEDPIKKVFEKEKESEYYVFSVSRETPTENLQKKEKILSASIMLSPSSKLYNSSFSKSFKERLKELACTADWTHDLMNSVAGKKVRCDDIDYDGKLGLNSNHAPNPSSRVTLGIDTDKFGLKRTVLDWQFSEIDVRTNKLTALRFAERFAKVGMGRIKLNDWFLSEKTEFTSEGPAAVKGTAHHMGTTRMSASPKTGVVDSKQKVFGVDNLYIAGSSVFTTTGYANPTFTLVQMTLRLADHLNKS